MYKCECGSVFDNSQKFNSHKRSCEQHMLIKYGSLDKFNEIKATSRKTAKKARETLSEKAKLQRQYKADLWIAEKHTCECCGKVMIEKFGSGRFCSRACANTRKHSEETKEKISSALVGNSNMSTSDFKAVGLQEYQANPKICCICGKVLAYERRFRKTCGNAECTHEAFARAGRSSANIVVKRSRNEIAFCALCEEYFGIENVLHNEPVFNGWDADIILSKYKLAILWNGPWHYRKITEKHSLEQVQNRDIIKVNEIISYGYTPYIVKDLSKASDKKVQEEFDKLLKYLALSD